MNLRALVALVAITIPSGPAIKTPVPASGVVYTPPFSGSKQRPASSKLSDVVSVKDFGAVGDGVADDTAAVQAAITAVQSTGGMVRIPGGLTYLVSQINMKDDVWLSADGATFKQKASSGVNAATFKFSSTSRSGILGAIKLDGNRANQTNTGDSGQFGVYVGPSSYDIYIQSVYATGYAGDGLYIGIGGASSTTTPKGIAISRWVSDQAYRNGVSITNAKNVHIGYLETRSTSGAAPQAGLDIEPNFSTDVLSDISIGHLVTYSNTGYGIQILGVLNATAFAADQGYVTIGRLDSYSNSGGGALIYKTHHVAIESGAIHDNTGAGVTIPRDVRHVRIRAEIATNTTRGIDAAMTSQTFASSDLDFSGSVIRNNSQAVANTYDAIKLDSDDAAKVLTRVTGRDVKLYDDQGVMTQRLGVSGGTNISQIDIAGYVPANATGAFSSAAPIYVETAPRLYSSQTFNYSSLIANGACSTQTFTITGAATNDTVIVSPAGSFDGMVVMGVAGTNNVRLQLCNLSGAGVTPGTIRFQFTIVKH